MKKKSMKQLIQNVRKDLSWSTLERESDLPVIRIVSDIKHKSHLIFMPDKLQNKGSNQDYLHELGHATLCEKIHPVFATNGQFAHMVNKKQFLPLLPALSAACDWFICHWQRDLNPEEMHSQIKENLPVVEEVLGMSTLPPIEIILDASLIIAQAIRYLDDPIECDGALKTIVEAFISVPPDQPSEENCVLLVNRLLASYTDMRAWLVPGDDFSVWEVYQTAPTAEVYEPSASDQNVNS